MIPSFVIHRSVRMENTTTRQAFYSLQQVEEGTKHYVEVRWGKLGTAGQSQRFEHTSRGQALQFLLDRAAEKKDRGYVIKEDVRGDFPPVAAQHAPGCQCADCNRARAAKGEQAVKPFCFGIAVHLSAEDEVCQGCKYRFECSALCGKKVAWKGKAEAKAQAADKDSFAAVAKRRQDDAW